LFFSKKSIFLAALLGVIFDTVKHQPQLVCGRQRALLLTHHLYALNAPEETVKYLICSSGGESSA